MVRELNLSKKYTVYTFNINYVYGRYLIEVIRLPSIKMIYELQRFF